MTSPIRHLVLASATLALLAAPGCDAPDESSPGSVNLQVLALSGGSCQDTEDPAPNVDPFTDISKVTVKVSGTRSDGSYDKLVRETQALSAQQTTVVVHDIPESQPGQVHRLEIYAEGTNKSWYASNPTVVVERNTTNDVNLLLSPYGGFSCIPTGTNFPNVVFPAVTELGDGRVLITGGFTGLVTEELTNEQNLSGATDRAFIWDPTKGTLEETQNPMPKGRAAHAAVFIPGTGFGKVLLIGGADLLGVDTDQDFPFKLDLSKARQDYAIFDVATETFEEGKGLLELKRAFPRAHLMADNTVVITGGGEWPVPDSAYELVEVFDIGREDTENSGGLLSTFGFADNWLRSGHSLTFIRNVDQGLTTLLVYGGMYDDPNASADPNRVASVMVQSNNQKGGDNGVFAPVEIYGQEWPPYTYFHEMTRLSDDRLVLTGGVRTDGNKMQAPEDDEAWLMVYDYDASQGKHRLLVTKVPGMGAGRTFHTALSGDGEHLAVVGGMDASNGAIVNDPIRFFSPIDTKSGDWSTAPDAAGFAPRAWQGSVTHPSGATLFVGGENSLSDLDVSKPSRAFLEIYTPSNIPKP
jgi:hypothetical protein